MWGHLLGWGDKARSPAGEGEFCLICMGGSTKGERNLAGAQIPSSCHCVAAGAISGTRECGSGSRFGEGAAEFPCGPLGPRCLGDSQGKLPSGGAATWFVLWSWPVATGSALVGVCCCWLAGFLDRQQAVSVT